MCFICSLFVFYYFDRNFSLFYFDFRRIEHNIPMLENNRNFPEFRKYLLKLSARYCEEQNQIEAFVPNVSKKRSLVIWKARDCTTTSGAKTRLKLVKLLHWHGLKIAGNSSCLNKNVKHKIENYIDFFDSISPFKFYLAFENSHHCKEYITEKLWYNSFYVGVVPVVWGGAKQDYLRLAPPNLLFIMKILKHLKRLSITLIIWTKMIRLIWNILNGVNNFRAVILCINKMMLKSTNKVFAASTANF